MRAKILNGQLIIPPTAEWQNALQKYEGEMVEITVKKWSANRSTQQNRYYWSVVVEGAIEVFAYHWGEKMTPLVAHEALKQLFLGQKEVVNEETGEAVKVPTTSTNLNTKEFTAFIESIRTWAYEQGVVIPPPSYL